MPRVLILGSTGMLGQMVLQTLSSVGSLMVEGTQHSNPAEPLYFEADAGAAGLRPLFDRSGGYDYVINCIGAIKAKIEEKDSESVCRALVVNGLFPHQLAAFASEAGAQVIHISTDGVFSDAEGSYQEDAPHDCTDVYGKTKSLGEVFQPNFLNLRCSIVGPDPMGKKGLLEWFLSRPDGARVVGYTDHLWNGVTTLQFAQLSLEVIAQDAFAAIRAESPVHHFCPNEPVSKYELLEVFKSVFRRDVTIMPGPSATPVRRVLATCYESLGKLFGHGLRMEQAVEQLPAAM